MKSTHFPDGPLGPSLFRPPRRRWPGVLAVVAIGAALGVVVFDAFFAARGGEPQPAAVNGTVTTELPTPAPAQDGTSK